MLTKTPIIFVIIIPNKTQNWIKAPNIPFNSVGTYYFKKRGHSEVKIPTHSPWIRRPINNVGNVEIWIKIAPID